MSEDEQKRNDEEIDLAEISKKIKSWFKKKDNTKREETKTEDEIDFSEAIKFLKEHKNIIKYAILLGIILTGTLIRAQSIPNYNGMLLGLDEFLFHRYAEMIVENGYLPENDELRYFPTGFQTFQEQQVISYMIAGFYYFLRIFNPGIPLMDATILLPVIAFFISMVLFFMMVKELLGEKTAIIATIFLALVPSYLSRTMAGVTDKESVAMIFWFSMVYTLVKACKAKDTKTVIIWGLASGVIGGLNGLTWGGANFLFHSIAFTFIILTLMNKITKNQIIAFFTWLIPTVIMNATLTLRYGGLDAITRELFITSIAAAGVIILKIITYQFYITKRKSKRLPETFAFAGILAVSALIVGAGLQLSGIMNVTEKINSMIETIIVPFGTCPFCVSVSENQPPWFYDPQRSVDWWSKLQWFVPLFMAGGALLVQELLKGFKKNSLIITTTFVIFMTFFMFSRFINDNAYEAINGFFASTYLATLPLLLISMVLFYATFPKNRAWNEITIEKLLTIMWFGLCIIATRGAIRVVFASTPAFMIIAAYAITRISDLVKNITKDQVYINAVYAIVVIIAFWAFSESTATASQYYSVFTNDWNKSMNWVKTNTPEDTVFTHWWDYGYWVQTMGKRATTGDGGNYHAWINEVTGGYLFSAYNMSEVLYSLNSFKNNETGQRPDYLLIMDDDVLKYVQMANIGGRPGYYAPFMYAQRTENTFYEPEKYSTILVFNMISGPGEIGADLILDGKLYPKGQSYVVNVLVPMADDNTFGPMIGLIVNAYTGESTAALYSCTCEYNKGCTELNLTNGIPSCIEVVSGGLVHIPVNLKDRLMTHLYLLNETIPGFEIEYTTGNPLTVVGMVSQGDPTDITIYKLNYTEIEAWAENGSPAW